MHDEPHEEGGQAYDTFLNVIGHYARFVKVGNPNKGRFGGYRNRKFWLPVRHKQQLRCFNMGDKWEMVELPNEAELEVWDSMYTEENLY